MFEDTLRTIRLKMDEGMLDYEWCLSRWEYLGKSSEEFHQTFFPLSEEGWGYNRLLESMGEIRVQEDTQDYQGDTFALIERGNTFGIVVFGWGSCSGCDALEAAYGDPVAVQDIRDGLIRDATWGTAEEILRYFREHDWEGDWHYSSEIAGEFREKAVEYLMAL